jgi:hypothetical protein
MSIAEKLTFHKLILLPGWRSSARLGEQKGKFGMRPHSQQPGPALSLFFILVGVAIIMFPTLNGSVQIASAASNPAAPLSWTFQRVDTSSVFSDIGNRSLRLDANDHPHIAFGG